jgi:alpha-beta hydrolase superfamily lysophospholipase
MTGPAADTQGVAVYAPDRRGSGRSGGPRGHLDRYQRALDDVDEEVRLVSAEHSGIPVFLAASSWAAKLGVVYAARRPTALSGLLLLAPGWCQRSASHGRGSSWSSSATSSRRRPAWASAGTWPTWSAGCRLGSHRGRHRRRAVVPRCRR